MPNFSLKVAVKNTVNLKEIQKLADQGRVQILVGFPSGRQHVPTYHKNEKGEVVSYSGGDITNEKPIETAELAKELSYGTAIIPARPFLEEGIASKKDEIQKAMADETKKLKEGNPANWDKVATMAVGAIEEFVRSDYYKSTKPNSKKTIEYKGSDTPLIDGGDMLNSLTYLINGVEKK